MAEIMSCEAVREAILSGKAHSGGLKMQACLALEDRWFQRIQQDVRMLVADRQASDVGDKNHPTNWVRPYGKATQYNLYNGTGDTADIHSYHKGPSGARFVEPRADALYDFVKCFESRLLNLRLNGLMPGSGLNPHEEGIVNGDKVVCRFHLPLFTSEQCSMLLDEENFYFRPGIVYFFNKGCVHGARNESTDVRYHLVWDMWLDQWIYDTIFNLEDSAVPGEGFRKLSHSEAVELAHSTPQPVDEYMIGMSDGQLLLAKKTADRWIKRAVSELDILPAESPLRIVESWYPAEQYGGEIFRWVNDGAGF